MVDSILSLLVTALDAVISWWSRIMTSTGMSGVYVSIMVVVLSLGILLVPILGSSRAGLDAGSDKASKWISDTKEDRKHTTAHLEKVSRKG